ncbi:MAG TPA: adenylate/guanylate cyclase domain-containing protein, partial [Streptosporangiaceae bacterium]
FDLGPVLPAIQARTLIVHRTGNVLFGAEPVRAVTKRIPDARCAELPGGDELPYVGDADALLDVIQEFLTGAQGTPDSDRSLATVLFTDIVGSTQKADELGDRRWRYVLDEHHARIRRLLDRFHGSEVDTAGDGFFVTFDGPARAVRCACAARDSVREIGIEIRAGLHTGEVERRPAAVTASRSTSAPASPLSPRRARSWSPAPCRCWCWARGSASRTAACTHSRAFRTGGSCSLWSAPDEARGDRDVRAVARLG